MIAHASTVPGGKLLCSFKSNMIKGKLDSSAFEIPFTSNKNYFSVYWQACWRTSDYYLTSFFKDFSMQYKRNNNKIVGLYAMMYSSKTSVKCPHLLFIATKGWNHNVISLLEKLLTVGIHNVDPILKISYFPLMKSEENCFIFLFLQKKKKKKITVQLQV